MKRLFMIGMSIILCMVLMVNPVSADFTEGTAVVSSATGERGETVYLTVSLSNCMEASSVGVTWEGLPLAVEDSEWLLPDAPLEYIDSDGAMWAVDELSDMNGDILKLVFVVPEKDDGTTVYSVAVTVFLHSTTEESEVPITATGYVRLACGHTNVTEFPAVASTCTRQGNNQYFQCNDCLAYLAADRVTITEPVKEILPLADHAFQWVIVTPATDMVPGWERQECENCDAVGDERSIAILPHTHNPIHVDAVAATCTEAGIREHWICDTPKCVGKFYADSACSERLYELQVPALDHSFGPWIEIKKPSATEEGLEKHTCTRCGHEEERAIEKLSNPFTDVPEGSFYYAPVMWAVENSITSGTSATTFAPTDACLRAHVVTFLWRAAGSPEPESTQNPFVDVAETGFYYKAVLWAVENGITNGSDATHFNPFGVCNRAAVVTFLWRAAGSPEPTSTGNSFVDVAQTGYYYKAVLWAVENGITNGVDATHFGPAQSCNRAQVVTFLYRAN